MADLRDFLATLPDNVLSSLELDTQQVAVHADIQPADFYKTFQPAIEAPTFTHEKAIFVGSLCESMPMKPISQLLVHGR